MSDRVFATQGGWALAADDLQWILQRRYATGWRNVAFVRSDLAVLARCAREAGVDVFDAAQLLAGLPDTFDEWKTSRTSPQTGSDGLLEPALADAEEAA